MSLLATGFADLVLTNLVTILNNFVTAQKAAYLALNPGATAAQQHAAVGFTAERDRGAGPNADELKAGPRVNLYAMGSNPSQTGGSRDNDAQTLMVAFDCYAAMLEDSDGGQDKAAYARLYYLLEQVRAAISDKAVFDLGFAPGVVGKRRWGRWQLAPQAEGSTLWTCAASWTFELDYSFTPADLTMVDLEEVNVTVIKSNDPLGAHRVKWSALYPDLDV